MSSCSVVKYANNFCSLFCSEVGYLVCYLGKSVRRPSVQQDTALMGFFHGEKKLEMRRETVKEQREEERMVSARVLLQTNTEPCKN